MTLYRLSRELWFPDPTQADENGLVAVGGDLSAERLLMAYTSGIFPWPVPDVPLMTWFCPDPRAVIPLDGPLRFSRSVRRAVRSTDDLEYRLDTAFEDVVRHCALARREGQRGTWITPSIRRAYLRAHEMGHAHSLEAWREGRLVAGLYGVAMGGTFCGESMFTREDNLSKTLLASGLAFLREQGFGLLDAQMRSEHLLRYGLQEWPRETFLKHLRGHLHEKPLPKGSWTDQADRFACVARRLRDALRRDRIPR